MDLIKYMEVLKVKDMMDGNYLVLSYDARQSRYGRTFLLKQSINLTTRQLKLIRRQFTFGVQAI
jgi:hypothetical protein